MEKENEHLKKERENIIQRIKKDMDDLTDDERMELFGNYCRYCGCKDPTCQCWNDE